MKDLHSLVLQALEIDKRATTTSETTLLNSFAWIEFNDVKMLCKTEIYHSWCKEIFKEVRLLQNIHPTEYTLIYKIIENESEKLFLTYN